MQSREKRLIVRDSDQEERGVSRESASAQANSWTRYSSHASTEREVFLAFVYEPGTLLLTYRQIFRISH